MPAKLGILAGGGSLPARLARAAEAAGRPVFVVAFEGQSDRAALEGLPQMWARLGGAGPVLDRLHAEGVEELVFAGPVRRPSLPDLAPDWRAARFFAKVGLRALGDDGLLRAVAHELEQTEGFRIIGLHQVIDGLLVPPGPIGTLVPDQQAVGDIERGLAVAKGLGALDVGQAVVVQQGLVLGVEAIEGTDALIQRCGPLQRGGPGGVLVKCRKPQQDDRLDLPTVGVTTVERAAAAGLRGIALEAGATLVVEREQVAARADQLGLFVIAVSP